MIKTLTFLFCLFSIVVSGQEKMTNFENDTTKSPNNMRYFGSLKDKAFFMAFSPEYGYEIWVSDGTEKGTQLLKDINKGELGSNAGSFVAHNSWAYFLVDGSIWKTDGTPENTYEVAKSDRINQEYFSQLVVIDNKLLAAFNNHSKSSDYEFYLLTAFDKLLKWEEQVLNFIANENSLFFIKKMGSDSNPTYTLYHYLQSSKVVYSTKSYITGFSQFKNETDIYCSITASYGSELLRTLIRIDERQILKNQILDWGNHQTSIPLYFKSDEGDFFLMKANSFKTGIDSLFLYKPKLKNLVPTSKIGGKNINSSFSYTGGGDRFFSNTLFKNNKLFFVNGHTTVGGKVFNCNYFDFTVNTFKQTNTYSADHYGTIQANAVDDSLYKVTTDYVTFAYNSKTNAIIGKAFKAPDNKVFLFELNKQAFELSDNIYKIAGNDKIPLITNRKIYISNSSGNTLINHFYNEKQYFVFNNYSQKQSELWVMDSLGASKIKINEGLCASVFQVKNLSDKLFYATWTNAQLTIYQTDGNTNGTSLAYAFESISGGVPRVGFTNKKRIIVIYENNKLISISKQGIEEVSVKNIRPVYTDKNVFFIENASPMSTLYKLENGKLKFLLQSSNFYDSFVFENRFYFKNGKLLQYLDENEKLVTISKNVDHFYANPKTHLFFRESISDGNYLHHALDLKTNKVVSTVQAKIELTFHFENNKGFYFIRSSNNTPAKIGVYDGKATYEIFSAYYANIVNFPKFYKNGILMFYSNDIKQNPNTLVYHDFDKKNFTTILSNSLPFNIKVNQKSDFVLIEQFLENNQRSYKTWSYKTNQVKSVATEKGETFSDGLPAGNYTTSYYNYYYDNKFPIWSFQNDSLSKQEPTVKNVNEVRLEDIILYRTKYSVERGNELFALGDGFSVNFAEIVKGAEGIYLGNTIIFNNSLYVYAFAPSHGWQVWKMGKSDNIPPLSKEEEFDNELINIFPNPVEDLLNIETSRQFSYRIINITGQEMMKGKLEYQQPINLKNLGQGLYIIQLYDKGFTFSRKIVKY